MMESRIDDSWRKVFDESGKAMGMKNGENMVWERIQSKVKRGDRSFGGQKALGLDKTVEETD